MHSFSRKMRTSAVAAFTLMLTAGAVPAVTPTQSEHSVTPTAHAQSAVRAPVTINNVRTVYSNVFSVHMSATQAMSMKKLTLNTTERFGTNPADTDKVLTINGAPYPVSWISPSGRPTNTLTVDLPTAIDVQPGTPIVVQWRAGQRNVPRLSSMTATMEGTELAPPEPPAVGNPTEAKNYRKLPNKRTWDACTSNDGLLYAKTWWDNSENTRKHGGKDVSVVEVALNGVGDLTNAINTADPRLQLRFGSGAAGWTELKKDVDYTLTVSGNRIFFELNQKMQRAPSNIDSFDVEAQIPLNVTQSNCEMTLWHKAPEWFNRDATDIDINAPETPRHELDWLPASSPNPALPKRCGGKIALVFDTSDSIARNNGAGVAASRDAGLSVINALQGTGSQMAIYNFASSAKSVPGMSTDTLSLNDNGDVRKLRSAVNAIAEPFYRDGRGGTNYEAGLNQVPSGEFDVVYFISDGLPTTSGRDYPYGFDIGTLINQSDLSAAVRAANRIKESGTRIETVMVGVEPFNEHILKDDYFGLGAVKNQKTPNVPNVTDGISKPWPHQDGYGYPSYYGQADFVRDIVENGKVLMWDTTDASTVTEYDITNQPEVWRAGVRNTKSIGADISSEDAVTTVDNFNNLVNRLNDLVLSDCFGSINVTKLVHGKDGSVSPGQDWTFDTSVNGGQEAIIDGEDGTERKAQVTDKTDENGRYGRSLNQENRKGQSVTVVEHQQSGYRLHKQNGKNAVCTTRVREGNSWKTKDSEVRNIDDAQKPGFGVDVPFRGIVNCTIENDTVPVKIDLSVQKVSFEDQPQPLAGSEFTLNKMDGDNREQVGVLRDGATRIFDLQPGNRYELVETQAPSGYQLLSSPIYFNIAVGESGKPEIQIEGGAEQYPEISIQKDEKDANHSVMQVADIRKGDLPNTGGRGLGGLALLASVVAAAAVFIGRRALN